MTRILWRPTALGILGPKQTPRATCSSVCAQATAEGSGSASDTLHFTPLAWVRNDNIPVSPSCCLSWDKNVNQRHMLWAGRDKRCQCVDVRKTTLLVVSWLWKGRNECWESSGKLNLNSKIQTHQFFDFVAEHKLLNFRNRLPRDHQHSACSLPAFCNQPSPGGTVSHRVGRGVLQRTTVD